MSSVKGQPDLDGQPPACGREQARKTWKTTNRAATRHVTGPVEISSTLRIPNLEAFPTANACAAMEVWEPRSIPPGTSKWNRIEHRLFSFISKNWRGRALITHAVMLNLIASTTTDTGRTVKFELDPKLYAKGIKVSADQFEMIEIHPD